MAASQKEIRDYFAKFGSKGGTARAKKMTKAQREESARNAAKARWAKKNANNHNDKG